ncbi:hypothetical protein ACJ5NV_17565 [Loktanella agnita]|uniref:hypothetical protein n=1 Tax=Loktanella agnita TaxID=287097 RepID=UPI003989CDCD
MNDAPSIRTVKSRPLAPFAFVAVLVAAALIYTDGFLPPVLVIVAFGVGYMPWGQQYYAPGRMTNLGDQAGHRMGRNALTNISDDDIEKLLATVQKGRKLEAVKDMRNISGLGLREAKEAIDLLDALGRDWRSGPDPDWR